MRYGDYREDDWTLVQGAGGAGSSEDEFLAFLEAAGSPQDVRLFKEGYTTDRWIRLVWPKVEAALAGDPFAPDMLVSLLPKQPSVWTCRQPTPYDFHILDALVLALRNANQHEDRDVLGFPYQHWHYDMRFLPLPQLLNVYEHIAHDLSLPELAFRSVLIRQMVVLEELQPWTCLREMPAYPASASRGWLAALERACADKTLKTCRVCPHRGIPLASLPAPDGTVTCPGHGLTWDVGTGRLVRRT